MDARKILDAAEGDPKIALGAIRELRGVFDLLGRLAIAAAEYKRLNPPPVDLSQSPEWIELQGLIVAALRPFPEARLAVVDAIAEAFDEGAART